MIATKRESRERQRQKGKIWVIDQSHDRDLDQGRDRCLEITIESHRRMPEAAVVAKSHPRIIRRPHRPEDVDLGRDRGKRFPVAPLIKGSRFIFYFSYLELFNIDLSIDKE